MSSYAGIGSRSTPHDILLLMEKIGMHMAHTHQCLRSGGAAGADSAFERGCDANNGPKEIFTARNNLPLWAFETVDQFHPAPHRLGSYARRLMARNAMQILGLHGDDPVDLVICWTPNGAFTGGTSQALRIAHTHDIPIHNLGIDRTRLAYEQR